MIAETVPETGTIEPRGSPTVRPRVASRDVTCAIVAAVGPNRVANSPGARNCWYDGDPGVETASTNASTAAWLRGASTTSNVTDSADGARPWSCAPIGTAGGAPTGVPVESAPLTAIVGAMPDAEATAAGGGDEADRGDTNGHRSAECGHTGVPAHAIPSLQVPPKLPVPDARVMAGGAQSDHSGGT